VRSVREDLGGPAGSASLTSGLAMRRMRTQMVAI
jgi:hypothetical protein